MAVCFDQWADLCSMGIEPVKYTFPLTARELRTHPKIVTEVAPAMAELES